MIKVSGHSDDIIEIEGDYSDEIGSFRLDTKIIFDDGTELLMHYDENGTWKAKVLRAGSGTHSITRLVNNGDYYSDLFEIAAEKIVEIRQCRV